MEGLDKNLADINALVATAAERLREHPTDSSKAAATGPINAVDQKAKTLAGTVIEDGWDLVAGRGATAQERVARAQKADEYAEIAADTFASIPRFRAITGGIARSVLLIDVSGQSSTGEVLKGMGWNFAQGAALNGVSRMAGSESAVGKFVGARLGTGLSAEIATHAISGGGFGFVKSSMSERSWLDAKGDFSFATGLRNVGVSTAAGTLIGIPAGMAGQRFGKLVTVGLGNSAENSVVSAAVQKIAMGAGSGLASGSVFGGVDAIKSGKSMSEVWESTLQGGVVGFVTGGVTGGFDRTVRASKPGLRQAIETRLASESSAVRSERQMSLTDRIVERSEALLSKEGVDNAFEKLKYQPQSYNRVQDFSGRLSVPVVEDRHQWRLKADAPKTHEEYVEALKKIKAPDEELDINKHYYDHFGEFLPISLRVYNVEGHSAKIVVPEDYARQLDEVRQLRQQNDQPSAYDRLNLTEKAVVAKAMREGDATALSQFMSQAEITQYLKVYSAGVKLREHPFAYRALPEDMIPILDMVPHRGFIKEVHLLDTRNDQDLFKKAVYNSPGFEAAATVGLTGIVEFYQPKYGTALYNTTMHEWSHVAKWQSPFMSKLFDLSSVVDRVDLNTDHSATAAARKVDPAHEDVKGNKQFYPNLHSTRSQDENFAVGLGESILSPDPTDMLMYTWRAPVRALSLASSLERSMVANTGRKSTMLDNFSERAHYVTDASKSATIGTLEQRLEFGTPAEKAAAAQLMVHFATEEQSHQLLAAAADKANRVVPEWKGTAAEEVMAGNTLTVSQHAFDAYIEMSNSRDSFRFENAVSLMVSKPELRDLAVDYISRSNDPRSNIFLPLAKVYDPAGTPTQRAAGVALIRQFGGENKADMLLKVAMQHGNDEFPNFREVGLDTRFVGRGKTVAQIAYEGYVEASRSANPARFRFAFENGLEHPKQRPLAAQYLSGHWDNLAQGYGQFLQMYDMPGHSSKMQELITTHFGNSPQNQKMVFERLMHLTDTDPRRQLELVEQNLLRVPVLRESALDKAESILTRGPTAEQRRAIETMLLERSRARGLPQQEEARVNHLLGIVQREAKLQEALKVIQKGNGNGVNAVHELTVIHDQRAIKPLLQQAVAGSDAMSQEAVAALRQFNPALVKFYAQELKRDYLGNPTMSSRISNLVSSGRLSPTSRSALGG
ncbi:MAG: hypothetical protein JST01_08620 [Cyanobacteria bacterium SZAS TMP-1]|nr:hypothetical protein [Cyanobacteria bacterium SZAS TMP-1]